LESYFNRIDTVYKLAKFISLALIITTGLVIEFRSIEPFFSLIGDIPTVSFFTIHIFAAFSLISSVLFITVFNLFNRRQLIKIRFSNVKNVLFHFIIPFTTLITGIVGLVVWEPFRWLIPFWAFNLGWDFIFQFKIIHLYSTYLVIISIILFFIIYLVSKK
jgi:hypothetical protein